jgi:hypothetical protein
MRKIFVKYKGVQRSQEQQTLVDHALDFPSMHRRLMGWLGWSETRN